MPSKHIPVLLHESIDALDLSHNKVFLDATYGGGGHSREVALRFPDVELIAIDQDPSTGVKTLNFRDLDQATDKKVDAILLDLGFSSDQIDTSRRGFSFLRDEPLDMRMSSQGMTAADILNSWDEHAIELILRGFGEERFSRKIAQAIITRREVAPFKTTFDLVEVVEGVKKRGKSRLHPATQTFQALRIAVNDELTALELGLEKGFKMLNPGGRIAVISFHSLEDRIVKNFFRDKVKSGEAGLVNKKPIVPTQEEIIRNPRSRSAKLRTLIKNE